MDVKDGSLQNIEQRKVKEVPFKVYHQNIRSLRRKSDELLCHLYPDLPHIICRTEHHMNILGHSYINVEGYTAGAQFCRVLHEKGGVIIYVLNNLKYTNIDLSEYCKEKDFETFALKLTINTLNICIITIYRSSSGNFNYFLQNLEKVLQLLYTPTLHIIICGDININYLAENEQKRQINNLLLMYNLTAIVNFPTRMNNTSASAIDNLFMDISLFEDFLVTPFWNDLSDHDAQILTINIPTQIHPDKPKPIRKIDKHTIFDFIYNLSNETWDSVFNVTDVSLMFNSFLNTYLRIFYSCFPLIRIKSRKYNNNWITLGIRTSCTRKRKLFLLTRNRNNAALKQYYKAYCKILIKVILPFMG